MAIEDLIKSAEAYEKERLDVSVSSASSKSPDQAAKVYNLSKEKGLPFDYIERNYESASAVDTSTLTPSVAKLLRDRQKAQLSHDDIDNLSWWEVAAQESGNAARLVPSALKSISSAGYATIGGTFNALSELSLAPIRALNLSTEEDIQKGDWLGDIGKSMMELSASEKAGAEYYMPKKTLINEAVVGGLRSAIINTPALVAGIVSRNPNVALGAMGGITYGDSYLTGKQSGLDELSSVSYAANQAIAEIATERLPAIKLLDDIGANAGMLKTIATQMAIEIPSEQVATIWQDAIDWAVLNPEKTLKEFMEERPDAAANTLISTVVASGLQTSAIVGIDRLTRAKEQEQIDQLTAKANESKLRGRSPEVFADYVDDLIEDYGSADAVYLDAKEARPLFQRMEKDDVYDLIASQIDEAEAIGGDIVIPMRDFVTSVAGSKNLASIKDYLRLSPESPTASQIDGQPQRVIDLIKDANKNIEAKNRADEIYKEVTKQLINTGRMNADTAKTSASIIPAYVTSKSIRSGLSVDEIYGMMGLRIEKADAINDIGLKQNTLSEWDAILAGLDYAGKKPQQGQDDETEFLSNAPAGTRYTDESKLLKRIRKSSDQAFNELSGSAEAGRVGKTSLGQFSAYRTQADIIEPDSVYPDGRIEVHVFGKEQDEQGLNAEPALTFTVSKDGELSVNGPTGETFDAFKGAGWAKESVGKSGEAQTGWTSLVNKDGSQMPLSQLLPLIADVHARVRAWRGDDKIGLHWSRSTGATGGIVGGRQTAVFFQPERGSFDPSTGIIKLTEASDLSTFLHESGHLFLEMEGRLFNHPNATEKMKADGKVMLDWLGLDSFDQLKDYETNDVSREAHEKFARGFEKYLGEGKAPSVELKSVFRRFAAWMRQVYRDLTKLNVELTDDVRAVMDRMLASDDQINRLRNGFDPLFKDAKDAGMTEAEFKAYSAESTLDNGKEKLLSKMMKQLERHYTKWWKDESVVVASKVRAEVEKLPLYSALSSMRTGGTTKEGKALALEVDALEETLRKITRGNLTVKQAIARAGGINRKDAIDNGVDHEYVKARFTSQGKPLFPATGGLSFDGVAELLNQEGYSLNANGALDLVNSVLASDQFVNMDIEAQASNLRDEIDQKSASLAGFGANRLNYDEVHSHFFGDIPGRFIGLTSKNGSSADDLAAIHGLASGAELIDLISTEPTLGAKVKQLTEQEMIRRHGDILNDGTIKEEAEQAIRNPEQAKRLIAELNALSRKTGENAVDRETIKAYAKETIGKMAVSKIRPAQYRQAEIRAAREAATAKAKGDFKAAQKAKTQEIINFYLAREAAATKDKAEANRKYMDSILAKKYDPKSVNPDYITQMRALSRLYRFKKSDGGSNDRAISELQSIAAWIEAQEQNEENGYYPVVIDSILSKVQAAAKAGTLKGMVIPSYKTMTADELDGIAEQARNLRYIGGQLSENAKDAHKKESDAVAASIRANASGVVKIPEEIKKRDKVLSGLREFGQDHVRLANQIEQMDGYKQFGPLFESFYQGIIDASNKELKLKRGTFDDLKDALSGLKAKEMAEGKDEITITLQNDEKLTLSRRARIVFGLYWGSPEGRDAIRQGHGMTDIDAQKMLNTLEDKDIDAITGIWAANEKHWPEVSRINQKLKGITLPKVEHVPYSVNGRELPGGYFRLFYQYDQRDSIREIKDEDLKMTRTGNRLAKQTKSGSRNERVGSGGRKISWEFNNVFVALDETIHDIAFAEVASKSSRFIRSSNVAAAIIDSYGKEKYDSMVGALSGVIAGNTSMSHPINGFLRHFRVAQTYAFLGYSIRNFVQQPLAYANVLGKSVSSFEGFGEKKVLTEAVKFAMSPKETIAYVDEKSEFMINRTSIVNRDTAELKQRLSSGTIAGGAWQTFMDHAFDIQTVGDSLVAYPAWMAAYNEGIKKFADEKKAVTFADEFVSSTIGSGLIKDMSPMLQGGGRVGQAIGSEQLKGITFMGSFFNVNLNLMRDSFKKASYLEIKGFKTIPTSGQFYRQMMWYSIIPALLGSWITGDSPDEDDESFLAWASGTIAGYNLATIFFLRDLVSLARGFGPSSSYTRALDASARITKDAVKIAKGEKDVDMVTMAKLVRSAGMVMPIPLSGQAARTMEYLGSDEEFNPYKALVTGVER